MKRFHLLIVLATMDGICLVDRTGIVRNALCNDPQLYDAATKHTDDGLPVHSFRSLLDDLATRTRNTVRLGRAATFAVLATPTEMQRRALCLLGVKPAL